MSKLIRFFAHIPGALAVCITITAALWCTGCNNLLGSGGDDTGGQYKITLDLSRIAGVSGNARSLSVPYDYYMLYLSGPGESQTRRVEKSSATITVRIIAGTWRVKVDAHDSAGKVVGSGSGTLEVGPGKPNSVDITMTDTADGVTVNIDIIYTGPGNESVTISGNEDNQFLSWKDNGTLTITAPAGYDSYKWFVDGEAVSGETGSVFSRSVRQFSIKRHTITVQVVKDGKSYSNEMTFTVTN
jgi:hypothetical protein